MAQARRHLRILLSLYFCISVTFSVNMTTIDTSTEVPNRTLTTDENLDSGDSSSITEAVLNDSSTVRNQESTSVSVPSDGRTTLPTSSFESVSNVDSSSMYNNLLENNRISTTSKPKKDIPEVLKKWLHFENITKIFAKGAVKGMLPGLMEGTSNMNISTSCRRDALKFLIGLQNIKTWAFSCK